MLGTFVRCFIFGKYTYRGKKHSVDFFFIYTIYLRSLQFFSFDINVKSKIFYKQSFLLLFIFPFHLHHFLVNYVMPHVYGIIRRLNDC